MVGRPRTRTIEKRKPGRPKKKHPGGRPSVMTPEKIRKLEEAFRLGCSDLEACLVADIGKTTLYDYQVANPDFAERKEMLKQNPFWVARESILRAMPDNADLALKYMERKRKDEFSPKAEIEMSGSLNTMTDAELEAKLKSMMAAMEVVD